MIPNEYGIDPGGKLRIGSKICSNLMGKILADLANMREESLATAHIEVRDARHTLLMAGWLILA